MSLFKIIDQEGIEHIVDAVDKLMAKYVYMDAHGGRSPWSVKPYRPKYRGTAKARTSGRRRRAS